MGALGCKFQVAPKFSYCEPFLTTYNFNSFWFEGYKTATQNAQRQTKRAATAALDVGAQREKRDHLIPYLLPYNILCVSLTYTSVNSETAKRQNALKRGQKPPTDFTTFFV